jgi:hypothetical protein
MDTTLKILNFTNGILLLIALLMIASVPGFGQREKPVTTTIRGEDRSAGRTAREPFAGICEKGTWETTDCLEQALGSTGMPS